MCVLGEAALAADLEVVLQGIGIHTLDDFASGIVDRGELVTPCFALDLAGNDV